VTIFGIDVSHHQDGNPDLVRARAEGIEFIFIKATEGYNFVDPDFVFNLQRARAAGLQVAAYHYVRSNASAPAQLALIRDVVPRDVPVLLDVESNSGGVSLVRELTDRLRAAGYRVPLLYLPRWYWQQLGSPSLTGLPPLWSSRYPDNVVGSVTDEYARTPTSYWQGYGGLDVAVLQFTSSARVAGYAPVDANAYAGTFGQLSALLNGESEDNVIPHIIGRATDGSGAIWVGDMLTRRHIVDETELAGLQHWITARGGDSTVYDFTDLRVLGEPPLESVPVEIDYARFVDDVVRELTDALLAANVGGATVEQIEEVVRDVFRDAGSADAE
jgi:GH25 family lysozyme M1 (1,4-beta-N-acetylmuramidase)